MQDKNNNQEVAEENVEVAELDLDDLDQVSGGAGGLKNVRIKKTKDVTDSIKKRI